MLTFDQYIESLSAPPRHAKSTTVPAPVIDSMKAAGILPATLPEPPSVSEVATLLVKTIVEMHRLQIADPAATRSDKRITLQNLNNSFLTMLTLAGNVSEE